MKKFIPLLIALILVLAACSSNSSDQHSKNHDKLKVVTTNSIIYDMVKQVGGDKVDVHSIVPVGQDPHEYEVKPKDIKQLTDADVIFYNGFNLESGNGWFEKALEQAGKSTDDKSVFAVSKGVKPIFLNGETGNGKEFIVKQVMHKMNSRIIFVNIEYMLEENLKDKMLQVIGEAILEEA